jgi:hypothetical protein
VRARSSSKRIRRADRGRPPDASADAPSKPPADAPRPTATIVTGIDALYGPLPDEGDRPRRRRGRRRLRFRFDRDGDLVPSTTAWISQPPAPLRSLAPPDRRRLGPWLWGLALLGLGLRSTLDVVWLVCLAVLGGTLAG